LLITDGFDMNLHQTFSALGDPTRFAIIERLLAQGELSAGDLLDVGDVSAPAISRHLKVLRFSGLVRQRADHQRRMYSVEPIAIQAIYTWVSEHKAFWEASLDRLEAALNADRGKHG
jgi:DNA-binding transcriptional ArsR family regulator